MGDGWNAIQCKGFGACVFSSIVNNINESTTACWGKQSCQRLQTLSGVTFYGADIRGFLGLAWTNNVNRSNSVIGCESEGSCYGINITSNLSLFRM